MTSQQGQVPELFGCQVGCDAPGVSSKGRGLERGTFVKGGAQRRCQNIIQGGSGALGNAAARLTFADK